MTNSFLELSFNEQMEINGGIDYVGAACSLGTIAIGVFQCSHGNVVGGGVTIFCGVISFCTSMGW